jgi:D-alanyl-D-alanine carboxypeptidase (penicillin-binding protein 5/6)
MQVIVDSNAPIQKSLAVSGGKEKSLPIKAQRDGLLFLKRGEVANVDVQVFVDSQKKAPIMQGETVGELRVFCDGIEKDRIPLIAAETIEKASYWDTFIDVAKDWNFCGR